MERSLPRTVAPESLEREFHVIFAPWDESDKNKQNKQTTWKRAQAEPAFMPLKAKLNLKNE